MAQAISSLPEHGRVPCTLCHRGKTYEFDRTITQDGTWRITNNPLAWGSTTPIVVVLGFSKGPTQAGALASQPHSAVPFRSGRTNLAKILHHIGLLAAPNSELVDRLIADPTGDFHFGSLIRCTVERKDEKTDEWKGSGGGMLDRFLVTPFGDEVTTNCATQFLGNLPKRTRIVVMLGLGSKGNYVHACRKIWERARPGVWHQINDVSYTDGKIVVVHTEHFQSQGALLPNWLSGQQHERGRLGILARQAVARGL